MTAIITKQNAKDKAFINSDGGGDSLWAQDDYFIKPVDDSKILDVKNIIETSCLMVHSGTEDDSHEIKLLSGAITAEQGNFRDLLTVGDSF